MRSALLMLLAGCGDGSDTDGGEDPADHACEEVATAGTPLTGGAAMDDTAPELAIGEPHTVTLDSAAPVYVRVVSTEDVGAILWADTASVVNAAYLDGVAVTLPVPGPNEICGDDIPEHFELDLEPGTWHLELGPAAVPSVWLLVTESEGHGAHE